MTKICIDLLDWLFQPSFDFKGFCECMDKAGLKSNSKRIVFVRGFAIESWGVDSVSPYARTANDKYDLTRLSDAFRAIYLDRCFGLNIDGRVPTVSLREWCGIRAKDKWPNHPWNKANNIQRIGGTVPEDLAKTGKAGAVEKLVLPLYRMLKAIAQNVDWELSNEPPMKWCFASEIELANVLNDLHIPQIRVHGSCSPETFAYYGDRPLYNSIETVWVHNLYTRAEADKAFHDVKTELPGFEPGGRYHDKVIDVRPSGDGLKGNYWNYTPMQIRDIAKAYEGYAMLWNPKPSPKPINWTAEWKRSLPYFKALAD